jgi:dipeptide transport system permease protein
MLRWLIGRLLLVVPTILGITLLSFGLARLLPGDPVEVMLGERISDAEQHRDQLARLGLDQPLWVQYLAYLGRLLSGDLGRSLVHGRPVFDEFITLFPATLELALVALCISVVGGVTLGTLAALRRGSLADQGLMGLSVLGHSMPIYWWGLLLIMACSVWMRDVAPLLALPVSGRIAVIFDVPPQTGFMLIDSLLSGEPGAFVSALRHLVLPGVVLGTYGLAVIARMTRSCLLETLGQDFVRAARARALAPWRVVGLHAMRSALIPVLTVVGLQVGALMGGAVLTETIFSWPGVGRWLVDAIYRRDYAVLQGGLLLTALIVVAVNLLVDLLYGLIDPRIRHPRA